MSSFADLAQSVQLALKALAMYTQAHPRCQATLEALHGTLGAWLAARPELHIVATGAKVFVDGAPVEGNNLHVAALHRQLAERQIAGFIIQRGVTRDELAGLLQILTLKPARLEEQGGVARAMAERAMHHITLSQTQYREVKEGEGVEGESPATLKPRAEDPSDEAARLLQELAEAMARWKSALEQAPLKRSAPDAPERAELADLAPLAVSLGWDNGIPAPPHVEALRRALHGLTPLRILAILAGQDSLPELPSSLRLAFQGLAPELLGRAATQALQAGTAWSELREHLVAILRGSEQRQALAGTLANALFAAGLSETQLAELFRSMDWGEQNLEERLRRVREDGALWELSPEQRLELLRSLLDQGRIEAFLEVLDQVLAALRLEAPALREAAVRTSAAVAEWVKEPVFPAEGEGALLQSMAAHFGWEPLAPILRIGGDGIQALLGSLVARGEMAAAVGLIQDLEGLCAFLEDDQAWRLEALQQLRARLAGPELLDQAVARLYEASAEQILQELTPFFEMGGEAAAAHLVAILGEEPDRRRRARLLEMIRSLGQAALPALQASLRSPAWYLVRNTLNLLAESGDAGLMDEVVLCLRHPDLRVQRTAIRALWKLGGPAAAEPLLGAYPHLDADSQLEALFGLGQIQATEAVPVIGPQVTDRGVPLRIRAKAIEALGQVGHASALPFLLEVARRRSRLFSSGEPLELRVAAARAILALQSPSGTLDLRRIVDEEPKGADRDALLREIQQGRQA